MAEKPIIFSGQMVRSILGGRKTQTRRVVKPQPEQSLGVDVGWIPPDDRDPFSDNVRPGQWTCFSGMNVGEYGGGPFEVDWDRGYTCPYGTPGSYLWVRETWRLGEAPYDCGDTSVHYRADQDECAGGPWRPSIYMPRWASRITLRITDVRVERVQDVDAYDAVAEGCGVHPVSRDKQQSWEDEVFEEFTAMWESFNGSRGGCSWDGNPWCWVLSFEVVK